MRQVRPLHNRNRVITVLIAHLLAATAATGAEAARTGNFKTSFSERSPFSSKPVMAERLNLKGTPQWSDYAIKAESFEVFVPPRYQPHTPHGLFVWINAVDNGRVPSEWKAVLDRHKLIWVGASRSGNRRTVWQRMGLALDAAHNMMGQYAIDKNRVYVIGSSGGGRSASKVALLFSDVFSGGCFVIGVDYFRRVPNSAKRNYSWNAGFPPPDKQLLARAKERGRYALMTGSKDMNRGSTRDTFTGGFKKDGFKHVEYFEQPGLGHARPNAKYFEMAVRFLDSPLFDGAKTAFALAQKQEKTWKLPEALANYKRASLYGGGQPFGDTARSKVAELEPVVAEQAEREYAKTAKGSGLALRKSLQRFLQAWKGTPVAEKALTRLDGEARKEYERILKITGKSLLPRKLKRFADTWAPSMVSKEALARLETLASDELEKIKAIERRSMRHSRLRSFMRTYAGTGAASEAKSLVEEMLSGAKR